MGRPAPAGVIVLVWDNLNVHLRAELRAFTSAQAGLRVFQLPSYTPDLNPVEMGLPQCELRRSFPSWLRGSLSFVVSIGVLPSVQRRRLW
jgi:transposase